jgi:hypothetical protein
MPDNPESSKGEDFASSSTLQCDICDALEINRESAAENIAQTPQTEEEIE